MRFFREKIYIDSVKFNIICLFVYAASAFADTTTITTSVTTTATEITPSTLFDPFNNISLISTSDVFTKNSQQPNSDLFGKLVANTTNPLSTEVSTFGNDLLSVSKSFMDDTSKPELEMMETIFSYKAAHADELTFEEGEIITLIARDEPEWWRGRLNNSGIEGLFPVNYVRPYQPNNKSIDQGW